MNANIRKAVVENAQEARARRGKGAQHNRKEVAMKQAIMM
jgi:hypothetical protein